MQAIAGAAHHAIAARLQDAGTPLQSLTVEFVDKPGAVIHTARFGATSQQQQTNTQRPAPGAQRPAQAPRPTPQSESSGLPGVKFAIAVGAGKGGVGKSTIAVNLAVGLARKGHAVGLMDGDIYGPSLPTMLALHSEEQQVHQGKLQPFFVHGIKAVTIGKLVDPEKPLIWRGPMAHGAFKQLAEQTEWGELDYLIIDLPPGTGDVPLTMAQTLRLTGAVVVCTPQKVAQDDAVRAARMFQQLGIDVLGVVENMSFFIGDDKKEYDIFGRGGAEQMAQRLGLPYLGAVPINMALRANSDTGDASANFDPDSAGGDALPRSLERLVANLESQVALASLSQGTKRPTLNIS
ncbi:MAG: sodium:proton antiporter [Phycisphaerales bacterium]|nr:MAG: sodium:proton antiporter [Phycisphaerales bacterium]